MKSIERAASESTCRKRITVCQIFDASGAVIATESNRCNPPNGVCCRMGLSQTQAEYPEHSTCNWTHAEAMAVLALGDKAPHSAVVYGHDFPCPPCEQKLRAAGVVEISVDPNHPACGLRKAVI